MLASSLDAIGEARLLHLADPALDMPVGGMAAARCEVGVIVAAPVVLRHRAEPGPDIPAIPTLAAYSREAGLTSSDNTTGGAGCVFGRFSCDWFLHVSRTFPFYRGKEPLHFLLGKKLYRLWVRHIVFG